MKQCPVCKTPHPPLHARPRYQLCVQCWGQMLADWNSPIGRRLYATTPLRPVDTRSGPDWDPDGLHLTLMVFGWSWGVE
jgi:hypothetical protein